MSWLARITRMIFCIWPERHRQRRALRYMDPDLPLNFHPTAPRVPGLVTPSGAVEATGRRAELSDGAAGRPVAIRCAA